MNVGGHDGHGAARGLRELSDRLAADALEPLSSRLATVVSAAAELLRVESVGLLLLDDTDRIRCVAATGRAAEVLERAQERIVIGPGVDAVSGQTTLAVADLAVEPRYESLWREIAGHGIRAVLAAPVRLDGQVVGNLNALCLEPHTWSATQRRSAEALAGIVGQLLGLSAHGARTAQPDGPGPRW